METKEIFTVDASLLQILGVTLYITSCGLALNVRLPSSSCRYSLLYEKPAGSLLLQMEQWPQVDLHSLEELTWIIKKKKNNNIDICNTSSKNVITTRKNRGEVPYPCQRYSSFPRPCHTHPARHRSVAFRYDSMVMPSSGGSISKSIKP